MFQTMDADKEPELDENERDFIEYMHTMAQVVCHHLKETEDKKKVQYYRGMLYSIKCLSQVYEDIIKGDYI